MKKFDVLTIFPEIIDDYCSRSIIGRAQKAGAIKISARNFRDHTLDKHGHVDDSPYGGGAGMVLQVQPIFDCLKAIGALSFRAKPRRGGVEESLKVTSRDSSTRPLRGLGRNDKMKIIVLDPAGKKFDQRMAEKFSKLDRLILICGRYEGFDERVYKLADEKISIGDYVLAGGELAALAVVEATSRLIPGVLGNVDSLKEETFVLKSQLPTPNSQSNPKFQFSKTKKLEIGHWGLEISSSEYPQYTRPEVFNGWKVPKILLSGDHKKIAEWRKKHSS